MSRPPATNDEPDDDSVERRRARAAAWQQARRDEKRECVIPECQDPARRERLEADDAAWLRHYFGVGAEISDPFSYAFTEQQLQMIAAIGSLFVYGGDQAIAASRGEGKTLLALRLSLKYVLTGVTDFVVLAAATGPLAGNILSSIKAALESNPLLLADYPEVCHPLAWLGGIVQKCAGALGTGKRHDDGVEFYRHPLRPKWAANEIILPHTPGAPGAGAIIATRGLDAAVRGLNREGKRPRHVVIDDPETRAAAHSLDQGIKLMGILDGDLGGMGGQQIAVGRLCLTTIQAPGCLSAILTDNVKSPTWRGKRFRWLITPPENLELWFQYRELREREFQEFSAGTSSDEHCRRSHQFYLDRREAMDRGAVCANPNRFNPSTLPDGSQVEVSALQAYQNLIVRLKQDAVSTEYDNDPPTCDAAVDVGLTPTAVQNRLSGYPRFVVPPDCVALTQGIDVKKLGMHFAVIAWRADCTSYFIDYGFDETYGTVYGSNTGVERAVHRAILGRFDRLREQPYTTADGEVVPVGLTLIDAGWLTDTVRLACRQIGTGIMSSMGFGQSSGCTAPNFHEASKQTFDRKPGDGFFLARKKQDQVWQVNCDTDRWKAFIHARLATPPNMPGALTLFGDVPTTHEDRLSPAAREHHTFARHLTAEREGDEFTRGVLQRRWRMAAGRTQNHYFDATYLAAVAARMLGITLLGSPTKQIKLPTLAATAAPAVPVPVTSLASPPAPKQRMTYATMMAARKAAGK